MRQKPQSRHNVHNDYWQTSQSTRMGTLHIPTSVVDAVPGFCAQWTDAVIQGQKLQQEVVTAPLQHTADHVTRLKAIRIPISLGTKKLLNKGNGNGNETSHTHTVACNFRSAHTRMTDSPAVLITKEWHRGCGQAVPFHFLRTFSTLTKQILQATDQLIAFHLRHFLINLCCGHPSLGLRNQQSHDDGAHLPAMHCLNLLPQDFEGPFLIVQRLAVSDKAAD
mmetsp:Transcript_47798/g.80290  ORF Transcript_47798/g.80290 Transcript_47798/m.80290 type:complete len:222 (+) Transcript_47798:694-1359(+)